ncbi:MAG: 1-deoxy-D-xylulose-5-phosphate synthase, partial [Lachnospiraceae bacterium]|nr:1-deoxy-D-xylulose-5-phosphate synthase [Lachnospiraceae bacterium]
MGKLLDRINECGDIKKIKKEEYDELASEIRAFILENVSKTGGHIASSLGAVELTMALHLCLDLPKDKLIWDVGHQSYTHKLLSGRKDAFGSLRKYGGLSGFTNMKESPADAFGAGHSSTSISAAIGYCRARDLMGEDYNVVCVIGDGSMTGGMAYEALNDANSLKSNLIIILNDNEMSIGKNVGGLSKYLNHIRTRKSYMDLKEDLKNKLSKIPKGESLVKSMSRSKDNLRQLILEGGFFEDLGIDYMGPIDGHNINELVRTINAAKRRNEAVLIHVVTKKGKGYEPAERDPQAYHG